MYHKIEVIPNLTQNTHPDPWESFKYRNKDTFLTKVRSLLVDVPFKTL